MCDYSLMMLESRLAAEGEELVAHLYQSGSMGLVSRSDFDGWRARQRARSWWQAMKECFTSPGNEPEPVVCIPPGTLLRVLDISGFLRERFGLRACEDARFTEVSLEASHYRDAVRFSNGATILLQLLREGQSVKVLHLATDGGEEVEPVPVDAGCVDR
jgi:hypothetical protein